MDTTADDIETLHATIVVECFAPPHDPHQRTTVRVVTTTRCPGCGILIRVPSIACGRCVAAVPRHLIRALNGTDPLIDVTEHVNARSAVIAWLEETRRLAERRLRGLRQRTAELHRPDKEGETE